MNKYLNILLPTLILSGCFTMNSNTPPKPKKIPYKLEAHGDIRIDNYYWMRDDTRSDPELIRYLESENEYFKKWRNDRIDYQDEIFNELKNMIPAEEETLRVKDLIFTIVELRLINSIQHIFEIVPMKKYFLTPIKKLKDTNFIM